MKFIIGKKIGMTQIWQGDNVCAVTKVQAGPCVVVQVKSGEKDGYQAVQLGFGEKKAKNIKKPQLGHLKKIKTGNADFNSNIKVLKEFRLEKEGDNLEIGDVIKVDTFAQGDAVNVIGESKGKGFQGVVKRHGFHGSKKTHGNKDQLRMPGSIGATGPAHVFKGMRMGGRTGGEKVTISNLEIIDIDLEKNELLIKGALPGSTNGLIMIYGPGELKTEKGKPEIKKTEEKASEDANSKEEQVNQSEEAKTENNESK
jgi:large subunit ribosomal protein L3